MESFMQPRLLAVGVGPGDPELLTLKGARAIREAEVVLFPVGDRSDSSIARTIVADLVDPARQELVNQVYPMRRDQRGLEAAWARSAREAAGYVRAGKSVVFVTLGDPFLYSTFLYLHRHLREEHPDVPVGAISGVSSFNAAAALAGMALGASDERLAVLPATYAEAELARTLEAFDTVVLMKVHRVFSRVRRLLAETGLADRAVYVRRAGLSGEAVFHDLGAVREEDLDYLSLVIVAKAGRAS